MKVVCQVAQSRPGLLRMRSQVMNVRVKLNERKVTSECSGDEGKNEGDGDESGGEKVEVEDKRKKEKKEFCEEFCVCEIC